MHCSSSSRWNQAACVLLAAVVSELFPETLLLSGQGTEVYFFYDFIFPFPFRPEFLTLIEERMRIKIKEGVIVRDMEMVPSNAAALLRHQGQPHLAELLLKQECATLSLCRVGETLVYSAASCPENFSLPFFKLLESVDLSRSAVRLIGAAAEDKGTIKTLAKLTPFSSKSPTRLAREASLVTPIGDSGRWMWQPRGKKVQEALIRWWQEELAQRNFSFSATPSPLEGGERALISAHLDSFLNQGESRVAEIVVLEEEQREDREEGMLSPSAGFTDRSFLFCSDQDFLEECISSLHFILQIPRILAFEFETVLVLSLETPKSTRSTFMTMWEGALRRMGMSWRVETRKGTLFSSCVEVRIKDGLGRSWTGPFVGIPLDPVPIGKGKRLVCSSFGCMERLLALMLEKTEGWLPFAWAPEQVRLIALTPSAQGYAEEVADTLRKLGRRVTVAGKGERLGTQLSRALLNRVPYVGIIGDREVLLRGVVVRERGASEEQNLPLDAFYEKLRTL